VYNKLILTDCDGVLLDWEYAFNVWMNDRGYELASPNLYLISNRYSISADIAKDCIRLFNESAAIGFLPPLRDAMHYVKKIHEEYGYIFKVITSLSTNSYAGALRRRNLKKLFGTAIDDVVCLDTGASKGEALSPYKDSGVLWIEDNCRNAEAGAELGLNSVIVEHGHNMTYGTKTQTHTKDIPLVKNWREIYEMVRG
jgi:FMN phosphatase YigB (HAD superfamily)